VTTNALAILVAAGRGERMGAGQPKAFLAVGGEPMLLRAARAFSAAPSVGGIVAVVPPDRIGVAREMLGGVRKLREVLAGGERRQDSVLSGLQAVPPGFDGVVLVHDAARPLVEVELIEAVVRAAAETGAAVPVLGLVDTVKRIRDDRVVDTLDRTTLATAQTPQGFRVDVLHRAYKNAFRDGVTLTDEAMAVERRGEPVAAVAGSARNRKLTTPEDLAWAEDLLRGEGRR
jgi:2-C-methyl-D-erythritol 4-phosphate cytidylyltransferase